MLFNFINQFFGEITLCIMDLKDTNQKFNLKTFKIIFKYSNTIR